ncbi:MULTISPECIES: HutD family protein [unclassified Luteimonas]|uniref:HutD/Ves family protein n=1 Tax=unclassified Luteimonas TaxID=2629088 RepID=UPI0018F07949|nr:MULTISPECIES: HutD family protein [unclassified Luteimonas]MBJ6978717.1 HutD family protein [Luteimonas sp. MC1895]MBJ6983617.1 HutD family protein [Luteimonas sp. MC1750]QQO06460.1 HutD family protein [Luteimonas sp. MC1750]
MSGDASLLRHLPACGYRRLRWRNGLGWTREIHAVAAPNGVDAYADADADANAWDWRLSIAEIEADTPYSTFPGVEREQVLLSGDGLALDFGGDDQRPLLPPHGRQRFSGDASVHARLEGARAEVFNLMWNTRRVLPRLWHRPLVGSMLLFVEPGSSWAVHVVAGQLTIDGGRSLPLLERGDSALIVAGAGRGRHMLEGSGELLLVRVDPAAGAAQ